LPSVRFLGQAGAGFERNAAGRRHSREVE
jgi:hypothetical protein